MPELPRNYYPPLYNKKNGEVIGIGGEKIVYLDKIKTKEDGDTSDKPATVTKFFKGLNIISFDAELNIIGPEYLKAEFWLTKIMRMLYPRHIPNLHFAGCNNKGERQEVQEFIPDKMGRPGNRTRLNKK